MSFSKPRIAGALLALTLVLVQAAYAAESYPIKYTAADQAAAKAITLTRADLGAGWKGGATKPELSNDTCPTKRSDLVLTGAAESEFQSTGILVTSQGLVLKSAAMVSTDWKRTVANPSFWACGRREMAKMEEAKLVSLKKATFPKLAQYSARYRLVYDFGTAGKPTLVLMDMILLGQGRSEITIFLSAPYKDRAAADGAGRRLAKILLSRIKA
jgi:hypothetical protein